MAGQLLDRILITGASGFIGQACLDLLVRQDVEIHALTRQISPHSDPRVCWHEFDLLNETAALDPLLATIAPTHLLHLAWDTTPATYQCAVLARHRDDHTKHRNTLRARLFHRRTHAL